MSIVPIESGLLPALSARPSSHPIELELTDMHHARDSSKGDSGRSVRAGSETSTTQAEEHRATSLGHFSHHADHHIHHDLTQAASVPVDVHSSAGGETSSFLPLDEEDGASTSMLSAPDSSDADEFPGADDDGIEFLNENDLHRHNSASHHQHHHHHHLSHDVKGFDQDHSDEEDAFTAFIEKRDAPDDGFDETEIEQRTYWDMTILHIFLQRLPVLVVLLLMQSISSFILEAYSSAIAEQHYEILSFFLTMLVGTGGNAGGQSAAVVIQGLANGSIRLRKDVGRLLTREMATSLMIAVVLVVIGFFRVYLTTKEATLIDSLAVAASLGCIVIASMAVGTCLPLLMQFLMEWTQRFAFSKVFDPATTTFPVFQVTMDILGIIITCVVSYSIYATLDSASSPTA
mmetsp:Transcript_37260/g.93584  ORF Transcript_37260/g.93584 Transcript_37260/m.93584 type:complete len:403 (+) Transcript_37260:216-1424(+)|eukprot:CAMPEP_0177651108 /NCGR_PEP_ID=MMETSP0447-20121125/12341_1 /TAXON_ID=0 /ORGANISM="Stygamoeba regulata, Strain BSH-02190019" /LENGTH=402 /DNA_ID=CAMNT_0019154105 /DNA_START=205 /DNA_END=1413 /DNA_ORIENTATION=+